jgi:hypothetical protein
MLVPLRLQQPERGAERPRQARTVIAGDRQPAALFRTVQRESGDDRVSSGFQTAREALDIGRAIGRVGEKVERCPVVPDVVLSRRLPDRGILHQPVNPVGARSEASLGGFQCRD